jgi:hypothetical protein
MIDKHNNVNAMQNIPMNNFDEIEDLISFLLCFNVLDDISELK